MIVLSASQQNVVSGQSIYWLIVFGFAILYLFLFCFSVVKLMRRVYRSKVDKLLWFIIILVVPFIGPALFLLFGKEREK